MQGTSLFDERARFVWSSAAIPEARNSFVGKPMWHWQPQHEVPIVREAIAAALIDGEPTEYKLSGPGSRRWAIKLEPIEGVRMVSTWRDISGQVKLTPREMQVLSAICNDEPPKVTARKLNVSIKTVESFRANIKRKVGAEGTAGIVRYAVRLGLIDA